MNVQFCNVVKHFTTKEKVCIFALVAMFSKVICCRVIIMCLYDHKSRKKQKNIFVFSKTSIEYKSSMRQNRIKLFQYKVIKSAYYCIIDTYQLSIKRFYQNYVIRLAYYVLMNKHMTIWVLSGEIRPGCPREHWNFR